MVNLDNTKALERIAAALEDISRGIGSLRDGIKPETAELKAEPAGGVPILLIVEVLISLIRLLRAFSVHDGNHAMAIRLHELTRKLEPYQPVRPQACLDGEEAE